MRHAYTWGAIAVIVITSVTGDVLLSRAMKQVGDVDEFREARGCRGHRPRSAASLFPARDRGDGGGVLQPLFALSWGDVSLVAPASASLTFVGNAAAAKFFFA